MQSPNESKTEGWGAGRLARVAALAALGGLLWLRHFSLPEVEPTIALDASWHRAYLDFFRRDLRAGGDYVFTYGPLAFLEFAPYDAGLLNLRVLLWEVLFKGVVAAAFAWAIARHRWLPSTVLFAAVVLLVPFSTDAYFLLAILAALAALGDEHPTGVAFSAVAYVLMAVLALVKLSYFVLVLAGLVGVAAGRAWRARSLRPALAPLAAFAVAFLALWVVAGQSLFDLPAWLAGSVHVVAGYGGAMGAPIVVGSVGGACALLAVSALALGLAGAERAPTEQRLLLTLVFAAAFFLAFKAGFVRRASVTFFTFASVATFFVPPGPAGGRRGRASLLLAARALCFALAVAGTAAGEQKGWGAPAHWARSGWERAVRNARDLGDLAAVRADRDEMVGRLLAFYAMPRTRAAVGDAPVDMIGVEQALLILNDLNYRPRPVFQAYAAYTRGLLELNARYLEGDGAPSFLVLRPGSADHRFETLDDSLALRAVTRDYRPVLVEKSSLLLEHAPRSERASALELAEVWRGSGRLGEWVGLDRVSLPCQVLAFELEPTLLGRLNAALYRSPVVRIEVRDELGRTHERRLVPALARAGFVIEPYLPGLQEWIRWYLGDWVGPRLEAFRVLVEPTAEGLLREEFDVRILDGAPLAPVPVPDRRGALVYSMLATPPSDLTTRDPVGRARLGNLDVLLVGAPSRMRYDLAPGDYVLRAEFGMLAESHEIGDSDGVTFGVALAGPDGEHSLFEQHLDPSEQSSQWARERLELPFEVVAGTALVLTTHAGPAGERSWDLAWWSGVSVTAR